MSLEYSQRAFGGETNKDTGTHEGRAVPTPRTNHASVWEYGRLILRSPAPPPPKPAIFFHERFMALLDMRKVAINSRSPYIYIYIYIYFFSCF